ncbi:unnamed protein product, partial [Allacma fusca]
MVEDASELKEYVCYRYLADAGNFSVYRSNVKSPGTSHRALFVT